MTDARVTQSFVLAVTTPASSVEGRVTQAYVEAVTQATPKARVTQSYVLAVVKGRVADPKIRVWTYTLDGHDFYVVPLGETETIVYDTYSEEWSVFGNASTSLWAAKTGINWIDSGTYPAGYGSNVLAGDRTTGTLYLLDPKYPYDEDPTTGETGRLPFERIVQAQALTKGFNKIKCDKVQLLGSHGDVFSSSFTDVTLSYSDNAGRTYVSAGTLSVTPTNYAARVEWRSLGSIASPGRLFKLVDFGAYQRIDGLEMNDPES